jgi:hypothetical protein
VVSGGGFFDPADKEAAPDPKGGAVQLSWGDLEVTSVTKPSRNLRSTTVVEETDVKVNKVEVKGGGVQYAFL